jgi:PKD repeat protein
MADHPVAEAPKAAKMPGWIKAVLCTAGGLLSGGVVTYLTPLVDRFVKPAKPLANFQKEHKGLTVTLVNRSSGGTEGWWDFGDGSSLEPVSAKENTVSHTYEKPGVYTVKLSLRNYVGEESERTVSVTVDDAKPVEPAIVSFDAVPVSPDGYAPATYRVSTKVTNADLCVFYYGDGQPMQVVHDPANAPERLITFKRPGVHNLKVVAVAGKMAVEKTQQIEVKKAPPGSVQATFTATETATQVASRTDNYWVNLPIPENFKGPVYRFAYKINALPGFTIAGDPTWTDLSKAGKNLDLKVAADRQSALLTGELYRTTGLLGKKLPTPVLRARVVMTQQQRTTVSRPLAFTMTVNPAGPSVLTLPRQSSWENVRRTGWKMELKEGDRTLWQGAEMPQGMAVRLNNDPCRITAAVQGDRVRVDVVRDKTGQDPKAN